LIKEIHSDGDQAFGSDWQEYIAENGLIHRITPAYTKEPNGHAERSGGVIKPKAIAMRLTANLPTSLWPEIWNTAVYLYNRSPRKPTYKATTTATTATTATTTTTATTATTATTGADTQPSLPEPHEATDQAISQPISNWESPIQALNQWLRKNGGLVAGPDQPDLSNLRAYGCRAYPLTDEAKAITYRKAKLSPRAYIGYLVGYVATNIYRIWVPELRQVKITRDVTFDEGQYYEGNHRTKEQTQQVIPYIIEVENEDNSSITGLQDEEPIREEEEVEASQPEELPYTTAYFTVEPTDQPITEPANESSPGPAYPTPETTPSCLTGHSITQPYTADQPSTSPNSLQATDQSDKQATKKPGIQATYRATNKCGTMAGQPATYTADWHHQAFFAGTMHKIHQSTLPPEPYSWKDLSNHPYGLQFKEAAENEWKQVLQNKTLEFVYNNDMPNKQRIPLTWVFKYKVDNYGFLAKFKARICVRGDLQIPSKEDVYAATLASQSLRSLIAVMAHFDLSSRQYDVENAFTNSQLDEEVYIELPPGFRRYGYSGRLLRALYGLRRSPLLWYKDLSATLTRLGLTQGTEEPCLFYNDYMLLFFYVDDITVLYRAEDTAKIDAFQQQLFNCYKIKDLGELKWFLGVRIVRDRLNRKAWILQDSLIDKIATSYNHQPNKKATTPLPTAYDNTPYSSTASHSQIHGYQQKTGSVNYVATISRPDIAFACSRLASHLINPSPSHINSANHLISYLDNTRYKAIEYNGSYEAELTIAGDASYADNEDRRSTQGYVALLFGGPVAWLANKQPIITASSTEAELVALTTTTKRAFELLRILRDIQLTLDQPLTVYCDNQQTLRLVKSDLPRIKTALKHVDVQRLWVRQEYKRGSVQYEYKKTSLMPADGLTKALTSQQMSHLYSLLNIVDIQHLINSEDTRQGQPIAL
jgi:hypothetical protein